MADSKVDALTLGLVRTLEAMKVDRPSAWSKSFEGLSPLDLHVLAIAEAKPDVILKEIKDYLGVPNSTLTGIIDRLEAKGLIERVISPRDRRSYGLKLTGSGKAIREEQRQVRRSAAARMLDALDTDEERDAFIAMIGKISKKITGGEPR